MEELPVHLAAAVEAGTPSGRAALGWREHVAAIDAAVNRYMDAARGYPPEVVIESKVRSQEPAIRCTGRAMQRIL